MANPGQATPVVQQVPITVQSQNQPLSADIVERLLDETGTMKELNGLFYSADEVRVKEPIYEPARRIKMEGGRPSIDPTTKEPIMEVYQKKIGEIERRRFIPFYDPPEGEERKTLVNMHGLFECRGMVTAAIGGTLMSTKFEDLDLEETAKDVAQGIVNLMNIRHDEYGFDLSTSKSIAIFKDLSLIIAGALNRSNRAVILNLIANTHNVAVSGGINALPTKTGLVNTIKRLATGSG
jgi:hypothetical protein